MGRGLHAGLLMVAALLAPAGASDASCAPGRIGIAAGEGTARFDVELAETPRDRARGLMFREDLAADAGMLFVFPEAAPRSFWMKNTPLPLDIVYISRRGIICSIARETEPFSEAPIPSGCAAQLVLEVNAGAAREAGVKIGAAVRHPAVPEPAWPCE